MNGIVMTTMMIPTEMIGEMTFQLKKIKLFDELDLYYLSMNIPTWIHGTIADVETRGLDPEYSPMTAIGFIKGNKLSAFVLSREHEAEQADKFRSWAINKLQRSPRPYIAYYKVFEEKWLKTFFDIEIQPGNNIKKEFAIHLDHITNSSNAEMMAAKEPAIMHHLVLDLLEELALYCSLSHHHRDRSFNHSGVFREMDHLCAKEDLQK